jgi:hypothetical protein
MSEAIFAARFEIGSTARPALDAAARLWFLVTAFGQWLFAAYVLAHFGPLLLRDGIDGLKQTGLANGFIPGDGVGNFLVAGHLVLAAFIMGAGPLQLIPQIRARLPDLHRGLGRTYMLSVVASSLAGLYLIWTRPLFGPLLNNIATSLDGVLIIVIAAIALRYAIARDIPTHRRWALRLFMVASSVWFLRIGFRVWTFLTGGIGIDDRTFGGPFVSAWHFGQYLLPLAVLEIYLRVRDAGSAAARLTVAAALLVVTVLMGIGIFLVTTKSWLPRIVADVFVDSASALQWA